MIKYKDLFKDDKTMNQVAVDFALSEKDERYLLLLILYKVKYVLWKYVHLYITKCSYCSALLYYDGLNHINREEMKTLGDDVEVTNCVIDGWARVLNHKRPKSKI